MHTIWLGCSTRTEEYVCTLWREKEKKKEKETEKRKARPKSTTKTNRQGRRRRRRKRRETSFKTTFTRMRMGSRIMMRSSTFTEPTAILYRPRTNTSASSSTTMLKLPRGGETSDTTEEEARKGQEGSLSKLVFCHHVGDDFQDHHRVEVFAFRDLL